MALVSSEEWSLTSFGVLTSLVRAEYLKFRPVHSRSWRNGSQGPQSKRTSWWSDFSSSRSTSSLGWYCSPMWTARSITTCLIRILAGFSHPGWLRWSSDGCLQCQSPAATMVGLGAAGRSFFTSAVFCSLSMCEFIAPNCTYRY